MTLSGLQIPPVAVWAAGLLGGVAFATVAVQSYRRYRARQALAERFTSVAARHLRDVLLPDGNDGWFHVDWLLLTLQGVVVVDLRDVQGLVFGSEPMTEWTVMHKGRRDTFVNPLGALYDRIAVVKHLVGADIPVAGRVVFTDRSTFPKGHPPQVTRLSSLARELPRIDRGTVGASIARYEQGWARLEGAARASPARR